MQSMMHGLNDAWVEKLLDIRLESPPDGYQRVTLQQIVNADRKLFLKLAELTRSGIQITAKGRPVDLVFEQAANHPDVLHCFSQCPLQKGRPVLVDPISLQQPILRQIARDLTHALPRGKARLERLKGPLQLKCLKD